MEAPLDNLEIARRLGVALAIGALMGLERQRHHASREGRSFAGLRTFILIALFGALSVWIAREVTPWFLVGAFVGVASLVAISYRALSGNRDDLGSTTEFAAFVAYGLGAIAFVGRFEIAVGLAVLITAILAEKTKLHQITTRLSEGDLNASLRFGILALVVLPLLPDRAYPLLGTQVLNPRTVWWFVLLVSAISFAGYVLMKWLGARRGIVATGLLGGLVSSTAVTMSLARRSRETPGGSGAFAAAVMLACSVAAGRVLVLVALFGASLLPRVAPAIGGAAAAGLAAAVALLLGRGGRAMNGLNLQNPFRLAPALRFGILFAAILFVTELARLKASPRSLYATGALAGMADVDAITVSMSRLAADASRHGTAATTILVAFLSNAIVKAGIAYASGERRFGRAVVAASAAMAVAGAAGLWIGARIA